MGLEGKKEMGIKAKFEIMHTNLPFLSPKWVQLSYKSDKSLAKL